MQAGWLCIRLHRRGRSFIRLDPGRVTSLKYRSSGIMRELYIVKSISMSELRLNQFLLAACAELNV